MPMDLVGKQMRRWQIDQRVRERFQRDEAKEGEEAPIITVSRQWGSGGTNIAKVVARELDFRLYDREIIDRVAELAGAQPHQIEERDERPTGLVTDLVLQLLEGKRPTQGVYLRALVRTVRHIAQEGRAVIVGRGACWILPTSYRVRIIAPESVRVARISELHGVDEATARRMVAENDRQRYQFVRANFGCDPGDSLGYDLVINTERTSIEHASALVIKGYQDRMEAVRAKWATAS